MTTYVHPILSHICSLKDIYLDYIFQTVGYLTKLAISIHLSLSFSVLVLVYIVSDIKKKHGEQFMQKL